MKLFRNWATISCLSACCALIGCQGGNDGFKTAEEVKKERPDAGKKEHDHDHGHGHDHGHHHHAPHHGSLTMLGDHAAQIELVVDAESGKVDAYVLDGEAEKPLTVDQAELELAITLADAAEPLTLKLTPKDPAAQGDGFSAQDDKLKGVTAFKGTVTTLKIADKTHEKVAVEFDAKKAEAAAHEAHEHGHAHDDKKPDAHHDEDHKDEKKAAAETKPEEKAAAEKPADEKPAEEKPAADKPAE